MRLLPYRHDSSYEFHLDPPTYSGMHLVSLPLIFIKQMAVLVLLLFYHPECVIANATTNILVIYPERTNRPIVRTPELLIDASFDHLFTNPPKVYTEFMDTLEFGPNSHLVFLQDFLKEKYQSEKIDVIVAVDKALTFASAFQKQNFPNAKLVYSILDRDVAKLTQEADASTATGVQIDTNFSTTLELAKRLQPNLKRIVCIVNQKGIDPDTLQSIHKTMSEGPSPVTLEIVYNEEIGTTLDLLKTLEPTDAVFLHWLRGTTEPHASAMSVAELIAKHSPVPAYCLFREQLNLGYLAGGQVNFPSATHEAVKLAAAWIKTGKRPHVKTHDGQLIVNDSQLNRWGINKNLVPRDVVLHKEHSNWWKEHANFLIAVACICFMQTCWISLLLNSKKAQAKAEQDLQNHINHINLATDGSGLGMWTWDTQKKALWLSELSQKQVNLPPLTNPSFKDILKILHPEDRTQFTQSFTKLLNSGEKIKLEFRIIEEESTRWMRIVGGVIQWIQQKPQMLAGTIQDVTELKKAKRKLSDEWSKVTHVNRMSLMGEMAASLAHEISQPLSSMINNAIVGKRYLAKGQPEDLEEIEEIFDDILYGGSHAKEIIQSVRAMARNQAEQKEPLEVNTVISDSLTLVRKDIATRGCALKIRLTPDLPQIYASRVQIQQVIINLIINALDAMDDTNETKKRIDVLSQFHDERSIRILIRDFGKGIPDKEKKRLFDRFYTTKSNGMGMGLSIARTIIENHEGSLELLETPSLGTCFAIILPIHVATSEVKTKHQTLASAH